MKHGLWLQYASNGIVRVACLCGYTSQTDSASRTRRHGRKHLSRMLGKGENIDYRAIEESVTNIDTGWLPTLDEFIAEVEG